MWTKIVLGLGAKMVLLIMMLIVFVPHWPLNALFELLMKWYESADDYLREVL